MMKRRIGLAQLMVIIVVLATGLAAMKVATPELAQVSSTLFLVTLLFGTLGAIVRRNRGPWIGFALFGWGYVMSTLVPPVQPELAPMLLAHKLVNEWIIDRIHPLVPQPTSPLPFILQKEGTVYSRAPLGGGVLESFQPTPAEATAIDAYLAAMEAARKQGGKAWNARAIFDAVAGLAFAFVGAVAGKALSQRPAPPETAPATPTD